jgi:hypothetical protein
MYDPRLLELGIFSDRDFLAGKTDPALGLVAGGHANEGDDGQHDMTLARYS